MFSRGKHDAARAGCARASPRKRAPPCFSVAPRADTPVACWTHTLYCVVAVSAACSYFPPRLSSCRFSLSLSLPQPDGRGRSCPSTIRCLRLRQLHAKIHRCTAAGAASAWVGPPLLRTRCLHCAPSRFCRRARHRHRRWTRCCHSTQVPHHAQQGSSLQSLPQAVLHSLSDESCTRGFKRTALLRCVASYVYTHFPLDRADTMTGYDIGSDSDSD